MEALPTRDVRHATASGGPGPAQVIALSFAAVIAVGTALLALPVSHADGVRIGFLDALFTATSAVCVTGLTTIDTGANFSRFGQTVILLLFQVGGFGILAFGALAASLVGRRAGVQQRLRLNAQVRDLRIGGVLRLLRRIGLVVLVAEAAGTLLVWPSFAARQGTWEGLYAAAFHAVSAFTNAGFALDATSLAPFTGAPVVMAVLGVLLVLGGFGYFAFLDLARRVGDARRGLLLPTRIALAATVGLLVAGSVGVGAMEWTNPATLGGLATTGERLGAAAFQGATPRTAGLTAVDPGEMRSATLVFTMLLMFVGGNPGSTAGGIKTVAFVILAASAWSQARGRVELQMFGRRVATDVVLRAGVIAFLGAMAVGAGTTALLLVEPDLAVRDVAFEAASAFGTVGLSTGITAELGGPGRAIVIALMFVGRLGPLTAALALMDRRREAVVRRPAEDVMLG